MNLVEYNNGYEHDNVQLLGSQQQQQLQPQLSDHLKCGEVYSWLCAGELYAVECKLCEDRPLYPLSEFPQHMEVWHTDWEEPSTGEGEDVQDHNENLSDEDKSDEYQSDDNLSNEDHNDDLYLSFTTEDSGLYEQDEEEEEDQQDLHDHINLNEEDILEPFEQVLIEQDNAIDTTQINEDEEVEKIDEHKPELQTTQGEIINDQRQQQQKPDKQHKQDHKLPQLNINKTANEGGEQEDTREQIEETTENLSELREPDNEREKLKSNDVKYSKNSRKSENSINFRKKREREVTESNFKELEKLEIEVIKTNESPTETSESENQKVIENESVESLKIKKIENNTKRRRLYSKNSRKSENSINLRKKRENEREVTKSNFIELKELEIEVIKTNESSTETRESENLEVNGNEKQEVIENESVEMSTESLNVKEIENNTKKRRLSTRQCKRKPQEISVETKEEFQNIFLKFENLEEPEITKNSEEIIIEQPENSMTNNREYATSKRKIPLRSPKRKTRNSSLKTVEKYQINDECQSSTNECEDFCDLQKSLMKNLEKSHKSTPSESNDNNKRNIEENSMGTPKAKEQFNDKFLAIADKPLNFCDSKCKINYSKLFLKASKRNTRVNSLGASKVNKKFNNEFSSCADITDNLCASENSLMENIEKYYNSTKSKTNYSHPSSKARRRNTRENLLEASKANEQFSDEYPSSATKSDHFCDLEESLMLNLDKSPKSTKTNINYSKPSLRTRKKSIRENSIEAKEHFNDEFQSSGNNFGDLEESLTQNLEESHNSTTTKIHNSRLNLRARNRNTKHNSLKANEQFCDLEDSLMKNYEKSPKSTKIKLNNRTLSLRTRKKHIKRNSPEAREQLTDAIIETPATKEQLNYEFSNLCDLEDSLMQNLEKSSNCTKSKINHSRRNNIINCKKAKEQLNDAIMETQETKDHLDDRSQSGVDKSSNISSRTRKRNRRENSIEKKFNDAFSNFCGLHNSLKHNLEKSPNTIKNKINYRNPSLRIRKRIVKDNVKKAKEQLNEATIEASDNCTKTCSVEENSISNETANLKNSTERTAQEIITRNDLPTEEKSNDNFLALSVNHEKSLMTNSCHTPESIESANLQNSEYALNSLQENCSQQSQDFFRPCKINSREILLKSLANKEKLRKLSESSSDLERTTSCNTFLHTYPNTDQEILKIPQQNLIISEISSEFENTIYDTMDIYDLLPLNSLENSAASSYGTESTSYYTPASLTSDDMINSSIESSSNFNEPPSIKPLTPQSPKTEDEHFEFYAPKEKLTKHHIVYLITLYKEHPRLWDQSHPDFCEPQLCRHSWQDITDKWSKYCQRTFSITEVRIRICTLCQRYLKERERLEREGELDESAKFQYYEEMQFLEQQKSVQKRRELYDKQNEKVLEIYQHFPVLWHVGCYKLRQAKERAKAFQGISTALKLSQIHLSSVGVQNRIRSLRKCYRLEKIRYLHCQVEQTKFESTFKHFEIMQFLNKHIDPFACRICGKIFENLTQYRDHLETENHGTILEEEEESENDNAIDQANTDQVMVEVSPNTLRNDNMPNITTPPYETHTITDNMATLPNENLTQNLETSEASPNTEIMFDSIPYINEVILDNLSPVINEVLIYSSNACEDQNLHTLQIEDEIIEEIMENVTNNDSFTTQSLDNFINSVNNCEDIILTEALPANLIDMEIPNLSVHNEIIIDQTMDMEIPNPNVENEIVIDQTMEIPNHNDSCVMDSNQTNYENQNGLDLNQTNFQNQNVVDSNQTYFENQNVMYSNQTNIKNPDIEHVPKESNTSSPSLLVKVQCADYSIDLKLNTDNEVAEIPVYDDELKLEMDGIFARLPDDDIRKMIALYRKYPQLWNPNHLDYNSRNLRRQAWCTLTAEYCKQVGRQFSWRTLNRKLTDYVKYYKKLITEQEDYEELENKWMFYEDLKFLNDVIAVHDELQRSVHHRDNNFKIIGIYKSLPQLWDIKHADFNKRPVKQRNIELMCNRLQEEYNLQITPERLKNRLIELRTQYRSAKKQRLKSQKNQQIYTPQFEFYEALLFIDSHIDPFICEHCEKEFKKLTEYNHHVRKEHVKKKVLKNPPLSSADHTTLYRDHQLENVCHICGIKFTNRSNLVNHIQRHEGIKNYECTTCTKKFFSNHSLKIHIRTHTKECPYTCELCGASFVSTSKLNQHVKRHSNKKDFACDYCQKEFFTAFERDRHTRRHLNIRDKICPICNKSFVVGSSYYAHMMLHNDTKRFECDKCDMKFAQYAGLYKHKKRHH